MGGAWLVLCMGDTLLIPTSNKIEKAENEKIPW